jgi:hypothetical protein
MVITHIIVMIFTPMADTILTISVKKNESLRGEITNCEMAVRATSWKDEEHSHINAFAYGVEINPCLGP